MINTIIETTETLLANPADDDARGEFAWAATLALNGLTFPAAPAGSNHAISIRFPRCSTLRPTAPGCRWSCGLDEGYQGRNPAQFERFARQVFGLATAAEGIAALEAWFDKIGTPTRLGQKERNADLPDYQTAQRFGMPAIAARRGPRSCSVSQRGPESPCQRRRRGVPNRRKGGAA